MNNLITHVDVNETDAVWVVRHFTGSGSVAKFVECYVLRFVEHPHRCQKFLGRFAVQSTPTFDAPWDNASEMPVVSESELAQLRKARMALLTMADKLWGKK